MGRVRSSKSTIAQALGDDFQNLHAAVRRHYAAPTHDIRGTMDVVYVKSAIKPLALVSYKLFGCSPLDSENQFSASIADGQTGSPQVKTGMVAIRILETVLPL